MLLCQELNLLGDIAAWHPEILVNEDHLCNAEKKEMQKMLLTLQTKRDLHYCRGDERFRLRCPDWNTQTVFIPLYPNIA